LAQKEWYEEAWVDDCAPSYTEGTLPGGAFNKVGVDCQGFAQKKQSLAQANQKKEWYEEAWIPDCDGSYDQVGINC